MPLTAQEFKKEHELIERELVELETIMHTFPVNYSNLVHVLKRLYPFWESHEEKESIFFKALAKKGYTIPIKKIFFEHGQLKKHRDNLLNALHSGSEDKTHDALMHDGKAMISKLRKHMTDEDWILYALPKSVQQT